jgi:hypothetical protein
METCVPSNGSASSNLPVANNNSNEPSQKRTKVDQNNDIIKKVLKYLRL